MPLRTSAPRRPRTGRGPAAGPAYTGWRAGLAALCLGAFGAAQAQSPTVPRPSALDAELFYQLLVSEVEQRRGEPGTAIQVMTEAARKQRDDRLFRRAVDMAIEARAADQALGALKEWRRSLPRSVAAAEMQAQVLMALGRAAEAQEPVRALIELTPAGQRNAIIASLPRLVVRGNQAKAAAQVLADVLKPWREAKATQASAQLASARIWWIAGDAGRSLDAAREAQQSDPAAEGVAMLGLEMMEQEPRGEALVQSYLKTAQPDARVRLAYARRLTAAQRYREALASTREATGADPQLSAGWLMQGALLLELGQPLDAQAALERYLAIRQAPPPPAAQAPARPAPPQGETAPDDEPEADADDQHGPQAEAAQELSQAYLMLAQAAEQQKDFRAAQGWLEKLGDTQASASVLQRRASLLARQGKLAEARALLQSLPEGTPEAARSKVMAETQLLRDVQQWQAAYDLLVQANARLANDPDLLYEQALLAERLRRFDEMEGLLRRVIAIKPDQQHAYNALGYSLADRGLRLAEARELVAKALTLAPGDPFITDSMGWVEFRSGNRAAALKLLHEAYDRRPDVEIAAHLGEVLWADGQQEAARRVWRAGRERDAGNEVLTETLARLKVRL